MVKYQNGVWGGRTLQKWTSCFRGFNDTTTAEVLTHIGRYFGIVQHAERDRVSDLTVTCQGWQGLTTSSRNDAGWQHDYLGGGFVACEQEPKRASYLERQREKEGREARLRAQSRHMTLLTLLLLPYSTV